MAAAVAYRARSSSIEVTSAVAGNMASEEVVAQVISEHRERFGRLDVLVNNAGVGVGANVAEIETKRLKSRAIPEVVIRRLSGEEAAAHDD